MALETKFSTCKTLNIKLWYGMGLCVHKAGQRWPSALVCWKNFIQSLQFAVAMRTQRVTYYLIILGHHQPALFFQKWYSTLTATRRQTKQTSGGNNTPRGLHVVYDGSFIIAPHKISPHTRLPKKYGTRSQMWKYTISPRRSEEKQSLFVVAQFDAPKCAPQYVAIRENCHTPKGAYIFVCKLNAMSIPCSDNWTNWSHANLHVVANTFSRCDSQARPVVTAYR